VHYVYTALPFGLNLSPLVYTKFMRVVVQFLRHPRFKSGAPFRFAGLPKRTASRGFRCLAYLDDLLFLLRRNAFTCRRVVMIRDILRCFGLTVNDAKSNWQPRTRF
jgi:hypothetical protein